MTGRAKETIRKRLDGLRPVKQDGKTLWYDPRDALPRIFQEGSLDFTAERARLAKEQADAQELKNAELRGELIPRGDHESVVISLASAVALRLDAIPTKAAPEVRAAGTDAEGETILRSFLDEASTELADLGQHLLGEQAVAPRGKGGPVRRAGGSAAPAKAQRQRVGRRRKKAQSRKQR